jgi:hypothetical protein
VMASSGAFFSVESDIGIPQKQIDGCEGWVSQTDFQGPRPARPPCGSQPRLP